jgi:hypothetical protein|tara:strand:+ start:135 stop:689 length:555 start_codon:yes stop_codon:yes gene_type:complete
MNIFALSSDPFESAQMMCDKHVVKMIVETAQLLSTAHRVLDGESYTDKTSNGRNIQRWRLTNAMESQLYKATHVNHPSAAWARESTSNYIWLFSHFEGLCNEYTERYNKIHLTDDRLRSILSYIPVNIRRGNLTSIPQTMPDKYKSSHYVDAYRRYYIGEKSGFAKWTKRQAPNWIDDPTYRSL